MENPADLLRLFKTENTVNATMKFEGNINSDLLISALLTALPEDSTLTRNIKMQK